MVSSPSNQPPRPIQPLLLRTHTHLTLATSSYHQVRTEKLAEPGRVPWGRHQQSSRRCCSHFPYLLGKEPKAHAKHGAGEARMPGSFLLHSSVDG